MLLDKVDKVVFELSDDIESSPSRGPPAYNNLHVCNFIWFRTCLIASASAILNCPITLDGIQVVDVPLDAYEACGINIDLKVFLTSHSDMSEL